MDIRGKVESLTQSATFDCEGAPALDREERKAQFLRHSRVYVTHPQRGKIPVMRTMLTSACERNCYYCPFQAGRNYRRVSLKPEELANAFNEMQRRKLVDGLFLSNGIVGGGVKAMDSMLDCVEIIRRKHEYGGYIHLKVMPGAEVAQIERAARLADRLSINLEGANESRLQQLAPKKDYWHELLPPLYWLKKNRHIFEPWVRIPSLTTQFVVGPAGESDRELLATSDQLYRQVGLARAYYSAFNPIPDTRFEYKPKTEPLRQHRLYQADWLIRFYGFSINELPFDDCGNLPVTTDPKLTWAECHLTHTPVEINAATRSQLLRVPGIGPKGADTLLAARRQQKILEAAQLQKLGIDSKRAAPFILLNGRRPAYQLNLPGL